MSLLVFFTVGLGLWHFTVFFPDRFWGGIVGALIGATVGAVLSGAIAQAASGRSVGETDIATVAFALPGTALGLAAIWLLGTRREDAPTN